MFQVPSLGYLSRGDADFHRRVAVVPDSDGKQESHVGESRALFALRLHHSPSAIVTARWRQGTFSPLRQQMACIAYFDLNSARQSKAVSVEYGLNLRPCGLDQPRQLCAHLFLNIGFGNSHYHLNSEIRGAIRLVSELKLFVQMMAVKHFDHIVSIHITTPPNLMSGTEMKTNFPLTLNLYRSSDEVCRDVLLPEFGVSGQIVASKDAAPPSIRAAFTLLRLQITCDFWEIISHAIVNSYAPFKKLLFFAQSFLVQFFEFRSFATDSLTILIDKIHRDLYVWKSPA